MLERIKIDKLVHGGQGLGTLASGKRAFVWNALPGEIVMARVIRKKSGYVDAIAEEIITASLDRLEPEEPDAYLSTSPWQILSAQAEAKAKQDVLEELFKGEKLHVEWAPFAQLEKRYGYRNKMEYSFWWVPELKSEGYDIVESSGAQSEYLNTPTSASSLSPHHIPRLSSHVAGSVSLALHRRGSHMKMPLAGSILASDAINSAGSKLIEFINIHKIQARQLKSVILRSQANGTQSAVLYVLDKHIAEFPWSDLEIDIFAMYYSNPKSPASVATELLYRKGDEYLVDEVAGKKYRYSPEGFFQINVPIYEHVLDEMKKWVPASSNIVDMYAGVGSIGMSLPYTRLTSVELDASSSAQAYMNAGTDKKIEIVLSESEKALDFIVSDAVVVLDPPRAGLHKKVVEKLLETVPPRVIYLSCNPATQARDIAMILDGGSYKAVHAQGYNFFTATPHIECLVVLERISKSV